MKKNSVIPLVALLIAAFVSGAIIARAVNASWGGEVSRGAGGRVHGFIYGFNVYDELITISWASVTAMADGQIIDKVSSMDGFYEMYLPSGDFDLVVDAPGYFSETRSITIGDGSDYGINFVMERNNQPIPEFPTFAVQVIAILSLVATLLFIRKKFVRI